MWSSLNADSLAQRRLDRGDDLAFAHSCTADGLQEVQLQKSVSGASKMLCSA